MMIVNNELKRSQNEVIVADIRYYSVKTGYATGSQLNSRGYK
jgi:hypothetical protein